MISMHMTMDPCSLEIRREGNYIGHILWHDGRPPRIQLSTGVEPYLEVSEADEIIANYRAHQRTQRNYVREEETPRPDQQPRAGDDPGRPT